MNIGVALGLSPSELETIKSDHSKAKDCLRTMISQWLNKCYNVKRLGEPSWALIVKAVDNPAGGNNRALAQKIANKHQGMYV